MLFALVITSCNKYANDFQELKDQIAALSLKVDGVAALQAQLTATTSQITALQAAVAALPNVASITTLQTGLNNANTAIGALQTALNDLATKGATAASVALLKGQLEAIIADKATSDIFYKGKIAELQTLLEAAATSAQVAQLRTDLLQQILASAQTTDAAVILKMNELKTEITTAIQTGAAGTEAKILELKDIVEAANEANTTLINTVLTNLGTLQTTVDDNNILVQNSITGLGLALADAQRDITILLNASAMYNDNVTITTDSDVDFYLAKLYQMGIINGNLTVNTENLAAAKIADLNKILGAVVAIIGTNDATQVIAGGNHHWGGIWTITTVPGAGHYVNIESMDGDNLAAPLLTSIRGDYTVTGADISDPKIDNVGEDVNLNYPGAYESTSLKLVGHNLVLVNDNTATTNIKFPNVIIGGRVGDGTHNPNGTVVFSATGTDIINFGLATGGQINNLTAANATSITLGTVVPTGLVVVAPKATSIKLDATSATGVINITTWAATAVDMSKLLTSTSAITVTTANIATPTYYDGSVNLDKFNSNIALTLTGPKTVSLPALTKATLAASKAETVTLAVYEWASVPSLPAVKWLTLGGVKNMVWLNVYSATLLTADVTGAAPALNHWADVNAGVSTTGNAVMTSLTLKGTMTGADLTALPLLTSLTTSGAINSFRLNNAAIIEGVSLGHNAFVGDTGFGGPGSDLTVTNNAKLKDLAPTAIDWMHTLTVSGNTVLASFNFSSYHTQIFSGADITINISALATMGAYVPGVGPVSAGNPGIQAIIKSNAIMTLKGYIGDCLANTHVTTKSFLINIGIPVATNLTAVMAANSQIWNFGYTNLVQVPDGLNSAGELSLVVAQ